MFTENYWVLRYITDSGYLNYVSSVEFCPYSCLTYRYTSNIRNAKVFLSREVAEKTAALFPDKDFRPVEVLHSISEISV